jgi:hypothetical protein
VAAVADGAGLEPEGGRVSRDDVRAWILQTVRGWDPTQRGHQHLRESDLLELAEADEVPTRTLEVELDRLVETGRLAATGDASDLTLTVPSYDAIPAYQLPLGGVR